MAGGKEILIKAFANELQKMEDDDFKFKSIEIGKAFGLIQVGEELQCVIPEIMNIKTRGKTIISQSYLIALSPDLGKTWYFIDTRNKPVSQLQSVFPNLSNKLLIPEKTEPQIIAD